MTLGASTDHFRTSLDGALSGRTSLTDDQHLCLEQYRQFCGGHGIQAPLNRPAPIAAYSRKARILRASKWAGAMLATLVFVLLNLVSVAGPSPELIVMGSLIVAVLMGIVTHGVISGIAGVDIHDPESSRRADALLVCGGLTALASFSIFLYLRFSESEWARTALPMIAMLFELGGLVFVAAASELLGLYDWPGRLSRQFEEKSRQIAVADAKIAVYRTFTKENPDEKTSDNSAGTRVGLVSDPANNHVGKPNGAVLDHSRDDRSAPG